VLPNGINFLRICSAVSTEYRGVTDGQTDTLRQHNPRYAYASRGKNVVGFVVFVDTHTHTHTVEN